MNLSKAPAVNTNRPVNKYCTTYTLSFKHNY